jgi:glucan phosphoethanolaminetransferase (alkaline phosphatase superfamily)
MMFFGVVCFSMSIIGKVVQHLYDIEKQTTCIPEIVMKLITGLIFLGCQYGNKSMQNTFFNVNLYMKPPNYVYCIYTRMSKQNDTSILLLKKYFTIIP